MYIIWGAVCASRKSSRCGRRRSDARSQMLARRRLARLAVLSTNCEGWQPHSSHPSRQTSIHPYVRSIARCTVPYRAKSYYAIPHLAAPYHTTPHITDRRALPARASPNSGLACGSGGGTLTYLPRMPMTSRSSLARSLTSCEAELRPFSYCKLWEWQSRA